MQCTCILENVPPEMSLNGHHSGDDHPQHQSDPHHEQPQQVMLKVPNCLSTPRDARLTRHHVLTTG